MEDDPLWYKDAIVYELHVRAFHDSAGDGIGDFRGLSEKLDYLKDLGVSALWLLPFYPSPLKDDGYDISDYTSVHRAYGTLADFKHVLREAHRRDLRVITELVLNHTSDQHPWFQRARRAPAGSAWRNFYVWSDTTDRYREARIIFKDFESSNWTWDPVAGAHYWHRFYSHQPDLNWNSPAVWKAMLRVLDFWLDLGVDGLRLDAVPYLHEREGTTCENLPETHAALRALRRHVDRRFRGRMLLAEANQWPEDAVSYFGAGDESHMAFHFPLMPRMFMALRMEDRYPIVDILNQTPAIPEECQWALFLRNHDELTLEMVTDEERDYMYRVYAHDPQARINLGIRRRLAPLLGNDRRQIELMTGLLLSLPGTPVLYYGDELGMGDNIFLGDRNGVRTPMQWSADRNAGFSRANPQRLYLPVIIDPDFTYEVVNVQAQSDSAHSLLWWTRRLIALRQRFKAFGRGSLEVLMPSNRKVLAFVRRFERENVLVVANLSRFAQFVELDLPSARDSLPIEMLGRTPFPRIGERPYLLTLAPHSFYWFELRPSQAAIAAAGAAPAPEPPRLAFDTAWDDLFQEGVPDAVEALLPDFVARWSWCESRSPITAFEVMDVAALPIGAGIVQVLFVRTEHAEGDPQTLLLPLAFAATGTEPASPSGPATDILARVELDGQPGILHCPLRDPMFGRALLDAIGRRRRLRGEHGEIVGTPTAAFRRLQAGGAEGGTGITPRGESCLVFGNRWVLRLLRRLEAGPHPDVEAGAYLTDTAFPHVAPAAGRLEYRSTAGECTTIAVLNGFVPNEGDAWQLALDGVGRYLDLVSAQRARLVEAPLPSQPLMDLSAGDMPPLAQELAGGFQETVRLLGQRVAELHLALTSSTGDPLFAPEPFTLFYQRSLLQSLRNVAQDTVETLRRRLPELPPEAAGDGERVIALRDEMLKRARPILGRPIAALRARTHGRLHLGKVLWTGRDFVVIDFQGDPRQPLSARRLKRSPLRDVAAMIHSLHSVAYRGLSRHVEQGGVAGEAAAALQPWTRYWALWTSSAFLRAYLRTAAAGAFLPATREEVGGLLFVSMLESALEDLGDKLLRWPGSVPPALQALVRLVEVER
jgi:maltose alpha-D-glucosyltransferase/alpha-amylase